MQSFIYFEQSLWVNCWTEDKELVSITSNFQVTNYKAVVLVPTDSLKRQDFFDLLLIYMSLKKNTTFFFSLWTTALIEDKPARSSDSYP